MNVLKSIMVLVATSALAVSGCSKMPQEEQQTAQAALSGAQLAEAETYAPEAWIQAQEAMKQAEAEIQAQNGKFGLLRSYGDATEMLNQALLLADQARTEAVAAKEKARLETQQALDSVRAELATAVLLLAEAPRGKGTRAEIESMQQELTGLSGALDAAARLAEAEDFTLARTQVDQVQTRIAEIRTDLETALAKVQKTP